MPHTQLSIESRARAALKTIIIERNSPSWTDFFLLLPALPGNSSG